MFDLDLNFRTKRIAVLPALRPGFEPIPFEKINPDSSELRAVGRFWKPRARGKNRSPRRRHCDGRLVEVRTGEIELVDHSLVADDVNVPVLIRGEGSDGLRRGGEVTNGFQ